MSLWSTLRGWFTREAQAPRLVLDGHAAWWPKTSFPLNVWVDGANDMSPESKAVWVGINMAISWVNDAAGRRLFMFPMPLMPETRNTFFASRATFYNAVVIQPYALTASPGPFKCTADVRYDKRSGELRNGLIEWNVYPGDAAGNVTRLAHELGHIAGLGHCDGTIMQPTSRDWSRMPGFSAEQRRYLASLREPQR